LTKLKLNKEDDENTTLVISLDDVSKKIRTSVVKNMKVKADT
jgi:hypothetical protein